METLFDQPQKIANNDFFFSAPCEDLKALIAQAHRSVYRRESIPVITDLIDNIMSIPSCLQDTNSKVTLVREWIKQNPIKR